MKTCEYCLYFDPADNKNLCRVNSPSPGLSGSPAVVWPRVDPNDWCAEGFNQTDGYYNPVTARQHGFAQTVQSHIIESITRGLDDGQAQEG